MITQKKPGSFPLHIEINGDEFVVITSLGNHYASTFDPAAARLIASAPEMLAALHNIYANAGESPEWIRMTIDAALKKATTQSTNNDHETN